MGQWRENRKTVRKPMETKAVNDLRMDFKVSLMAYAQPSKLSWCPRCSLLWDDSLQEQITTAFITLMGTN